MQPVVLVVPREAGTAGHEWVIAVADGVGGDVAEVLRDSRRRLLRHPDRLKPPDEDQLRAVDVVRFQEHAVPGWRSRACGQGGSSCVVAGGNAINEVAIALSEPGAVRTMLGYNLISCLNRLSESSSSNRIVFTAT